MQQAYTTTHVKQVKTAENAKCSMRAHAHDSGENVCFLGVRVMFSYI